MPIILIRGCPTASTIRARSTASSFLPALRQVSERVSARFDNGKVDRSRYCRHHEESADPQKFPVKGDGGLKLLCLALKPHLPFWLGKMRDAVIDNLHRNEDQHDKGELGGKPPCLGRRPATCP